jgi:hypothetical protein
VGTPAVAKVERQPAAESGEVSGDRAEPSSLWDRLRPLEQAADRPQMPLTSGSISAGGTLALTWCRRKTLSSIASSMS